MKKAILSLVVLLFTNALLAQTSFDKFSNHEEVTTIIVNKKMLELMSKVSVDASDQETQRYMSLIKKLDNLKVFSTASTKISMDMKAAATAYAKTAGLEELVRIQENGKNIWIATKPANDSINIKELLLFMESTNSENQTILMSMLGTFDLNEIAILTDKMHLPGGSDIKKATKVQRN
ncbi:DUF4252 domain-containing protein [Flavobacterium crassostreae]|uniref:DUF4252 domain-containing protein n=1 Tax=Flavobacterium crassostreae TaxID=1763534 RepID=A0A1B9E7E9_9FLAO|nr:DUF4252 domain-containing protein [Flavobacterium crassostreae]OCB77870.1 hypothetical protein LPBF_02645 [Flavobacterium crassostreae]